MKINGMYDDTPKAEPKAEKPTPEPRPEFIEREPFSVGVVFPENVGYGTSVFALRPRQDAEKIKARMLGMIEKNTNVSREYVEAVKNTPAESLLSLEYFEVFNVSIGGAAIDRKVEHSVYKDSDKYCVESTVNGDTVTSTVTRGRELDYTYSTKEVEHKKFDLPMERHVSDLGGWAYTVFVANASDILTEEEFKASTRVRFDADGDSRATTAYIASCIKKGDFKGEPENITLKQTMWFPVWRAVVTLGGKEYVSFISDEPSDRVAIGGMSAISAPVRPRSGMQMLVSGLKHMTLVVKTFCAISAAFMLMWMGEFAANVNYALIATIVVNIVFAVAFHTEFEEKGDYPIAINAGYKSGEKAIKVILNTLLSLGTIALFTVYFILNI